MKNSIWLKFFSSLLSLVLVLSLLVPLQAAADNGTSAAQSESDLEMRAAIAEQLHSIERGPRLHPDLMKLAGESEVDVIIHFSEKPVGLQKGIQASEGKEMSDGQENKAKSSVQKQQAAAKQAMAANNIFIKEGFTYETVLNAISATVKAADLGKLLEIDGVVLVEPDTETYALETPVKDEAPTSAADNSVSFLGIEELWAEGLQGQGVKVAVLDTGIDTEHPEFAGIYKGGRNFISHSAGTYTTVRAADDASETLPSERAAGQPEISEAGNPFYTSHGTHVAGIIAAIGDNDYDIQGIAPQVDLYAYRILGAYGRGTSSSMIAGIEEAVAQDMDVINISLGLGGGGNSENDAAAYAINNAMLSGVTAVVATGNTGDSRSTIVTPATSPFGIAVGNSTMPEAKHDATVRVTAGEYSYAQNLNLMSTTFGSKPAQQLEGTFEIVAVPGLGKPADYENLDVNGKIVLIARGEITFINKIRIAKEQGAAGAIIHNASGTGPSNVTIGDDFDLIPTFDMNLPDGKTLREQLAQTEGTVTFTDWNKTYSAGDRIQANSSRGPSNPNFDIKPDVVAPGTNIMSTVPMYGADFPDASYSEAYERMTGTSMAAPHISGIAALILQANPDWSPFDVKVALSNTAKVLDTEIFDVFAQGAGRVNPYAAVHPEFVAFTKDEANRNEEETGENQKGTITFGPQRLEEEGILVTKEVIVEDIAGNGGDFDITVEVTKSFHDAEVVVDQSMFSLNGEHSFNVSLGASQFAGAKPGNEILGYIHINRGEERISLPFAADFNAEVKPEVKSFSISETDLSFNGDGVNDSAVLNYEITAAVNPYYIDLYDILAGVNGADPYIGSIEMGGLKEAGKYEVLVDGNFFNYGTGEDEIIPDGIYNIDYYGITVSNPPPFIGAYSETIFVKSTLPEIEADITDGQLSGSVEDRYFFYNEELSKYGEGFDINEKLSASYVISRNGTEEEAVDFELQEDGTFSLSIDEAGVEVVTVTVEDAAGNIGEMELPFVRTALSIDQNDLNLQVGESVTLTVTETTTIGRDEPTTKEVTADATYRVHGNQSVQADGGLLTALKPGAAKVFITFDDNEILFNAKVSPKKGKKN